MVCISEFWCMYNPELTEYIYIIHIIYTFYVKIRLKMLIQSFLQTSSIKCSINVVSMIWTSSKLPIIYKYAIYLYGFSEKTCIQEVSHVKHH